MFKIESIQLNYQEPIVFNYPSCFIYGENDVGKTLLFEILDYMLGSTELNGTKEIWKKEGMSNIRFISIVISNGQKRVSLRRTKEHELFYKIGDDDIYSLISKERYVEIIQQLFSNSAKYLDNYKYAVNEKLSFRGLSYINFVDEFGIGMINPIFKEALEAQDCARIHDQMAFFFDFQKLKEIVSKQKDIDAKEEELQMLSFSKEKENYIRRRIKDNFNLLSIEYSDQMSENEQNFLKYLHDSNDSGQNEKKTKTENDLIFLLTMSAELENQLNATKLYAKQTDSIIDYTEKMNVLLNFFKNSILDNAELSEYVSSLEALLKNNNDDLQILSSKDYAKTMQNIIEKKKNIDARINEIKKSLDNFNYVERQTIISETKKLLNEYKTIKNVADYENLSKQIKDLKDDLRSLNKQFKGKINPDFNNDILNLYSKLNENRIDFAVEDFQNKDFQLLYVPSTSSVVSLKAEIGKNEQAKSYVSGSKARHTTWQLLARLALICYIRDTFNDFPILPVIVIDAIQEPFDDDNVLETFYRIYSEECEKQSIQLIVTSARKLNADYSYDIDISGGLNKEIK